MKENQFRHALMYGGVSGGIMAFFFFMIQAFGRANNESLSSFVYGVLIAGVYISVKHYRDRNLGGFINFGMAFSTGLFTALVNGGIGGIYNYFLFKYINPGLKEELIINMQETLLNSGKPDEQIELQTTLLEQFLTPGTMAVSIVFYALIMGSILSLLIAGLLKRSENPFINNSNQISNS